MKLRLGTRGSRLALAQARTVAGWLEARTPDLSVEIVEIRTSGDRIQDVPLGPHLGQAFFTKEIEDALLERRVDLAVHSCKDLATTFPRGLALGAVPPREDPRDALLSSGGLLQTLPPGATVGTSSPRRKLFLGRFRGDLTVMDQRGNVPTRVAALDEGRYDAVVLAVSGLKRLGLGSRITQILDPEVMLPAAAQGALAVQIREDDGATAQVVGLLDDATARAEVTAERACLRRLEAGCQAPVGVLGRAEAGVLHVRGAVLGGGADVWDRAEGELADAEALGVRLAESLLEQMGLTSLRGVAWAGPPPRDVES